MGKPYKSTEEEITYRRNLRRVLPKGQFVVFADDPEHKYVVCGFGVQGLFRKPYRKTCRYIWLLDPETLEDVLIYDTETGHTAQQKCLRAVVEQPDEPDLAIKPIVLYHAPRAEGIERTFAENPPKYVRQQQEKEKRRQQREQKKEKKNNDNKQQ